MDRTLLIKRVPRLIITSLESGFAMPQSELNFGSGTGTEETMNQG